MDVGTLSLDDIIQKKGIRGNKFGNRQRRDGGVQKPKGSKPRAWDNDKLSQGQSEGRRRNGGTRVAIRSASGGGKAIARLSNVPYNITQEDLNDLFAEFNLSRISLHYDFRGKPIGTAELHGGSNVISKLAREFKNVEIDGRPLEIQVVGSGGSPNRGIQTRTRRPNSGGKSRSPGNRRSIGGARSGGKSKEARKPKLTAEQLDQELEAYMAGGKN